ncbi:MAG: DUF4203 domain-containing protein [Candidatus Goldbacteria bacterium]|nr:DUF4203 domain-containing protein [Candidatus Goldiibacteriota bacterium]
MLELKLVSLLLIVVGLIISYFGYFAFKMTIKIISFLIVLGLFILIAVLIKNHIASILLICAGLFAGIFVVMKIDTYELIKFATALIMAFIFIVIGLAVLLFFNANFSFIISSIIILGILGLVLGDTLLNKYFLVIVTSLIGAIIFVYGLNNILIDDFNNINIIKYRKLIHSFFNNLFFYIVIFFVIFISGMIIQYLFIKKFDRPKTESEIAENML